jgi:hypothetical protein
VPRKQNPPGLRPAGPVSFVPKGIAKLAILETYGNQGDGLLPPKPHGM